jgi:diguanylate cyclase (GGDEF)-like protein
MIPRILVVGEEPATLAGVERAVHEAWATAEVLHEPGLAAALPRLAREGADCLLVDLGTQRLEAIAEAREAAPGVPVIALTRDDDGPEAVAAMRRGAEDCVIRDPLRAPVLARAIRLGIERHAAHRAAVGRAMHDPVTGLPSRALFVEHLAHSLAKRRPRGSVAVTFLDLDRFKPVNDELGHAAGDAVLAEVGRRVAATLRPGDVVARYGGDEFTVLFEDAAEEDVVAIARRLIGAVRAPIQTDAGLAQVGASVGIAFAGGRAGTITPSALMRAADRAMYDAKAGGGGLAVAHDLVGGASPGRGSDIRCA